MRLSLAMLLDALNHFQTLDQTMNTTTFFTYCGALLVLGTAEFAQAQPTIPDFGSAVFSNSLQIDNPYYPLVPSTTLIYDGVNTDPATGETESEVILIEVLNQTRTVAGIEARVVRDRVFLEGLLIEDTFDWYAQDDAGNVWYLGEDVTDFHYDDGGNLIGTSHPGTWETGVDGALPGHIMKAAPLLGDYYYQELYAGEAEDSALVIGVGESHTVPHGSFTGVLHTRDFSLDPTAYGDKFYGPGVGSIMEHDIDATTGTILGVTVLRSVSVVPETRSAILAILGAAGILVRRRHRTC